MNVKTNSFYIEAASSKKPNAADSKQEEKNNHKAAANPDSLPSSKRSNRE